MRKAIPYLVGIGELQRQAPSVIKEVESKHQEGFIVSHNQPQAVLMSLKRYAQLKALEEVRRMEEDEILAVIRRGDSEFEKGETKKVKSLKEIF